MSNNAASLPNFELLYFCGLTLCGCLSSGWGWYILTTRRLQWGIGKRLMFWFPLNVLAVVLYWHIGSILLGVRLPN